MLRHPTLKAHLTAGAVPGEGVILVSEEGSWTLQGALFEQVLPLLDGARTPEQIVAALAPAPRAEVYYALEVLEKKGHLMDRAPGLEAAHAAYWAGLGLDPGSAWAALRAGRVRIRCAGPLDAAPLIRSLEEAGLDLGTGEPGLEIAVTDDYLREDLLSWASAAREAGLPWMVLRPIGREFWIGPLFTSGASACFGCLRHRLRRNEQVQEFLRHRNAWTDPLPTAVAALPAAVGAACRLAAVEIAKFLAGAPHNLQDRVLSMDTRTWVSRSHALVRYPACPVCGDPPRQRPGPVRLVRRAAGPSEGSGHRVAPPEATLEKYGHLVSPIAGIVSMVEPPPGTGGVFQVCMGGINGAIAVDSLAAFKTGFRHRSAGKGPTLAQAKASALAESLERYSTEFTGSEFRILKSCRELGDAAIHPNAVMGFSERQFRERELWNARGSRFNAVPEPLDLDRPIPWSPVWSLSEEREKLAAHPVPLFPRPRGLPGTLAPVLPRLLQRQRRRQQPGGGGAPGLHGTGRAGRHRHLVVQPPAAPRRGPRQFPPGLPGRPGGPLRRPGPGPLGAGPHPRPGHPRLRRRLLQPGHPGPHPLRPGLQPGPGGRPAARLRGAEPVHLRHRTQGRGTPGRR